MFRGQRARVWWTIVGATQLLRAVFWLPDPASIQSRPFDNAFRTLLYLPYTSLLMYLSRRWPLGGPHFARHLVRHAVASLVLASTHLTLQALSLALTLNSSRALTFDAAT